ncbi:unnamed protein product [Cyclocybe aegerita]|uniref:polynucleotide adenylyltransferase n=1 Tax=Cyclocybe aegerita TaxID=1973307 RepID=A0A8S0VUX2_CYCAE|nr:unnamed protein product [Cyclocybe aegerita]
MACNLAARRAAASLFGDAQPPQTTFCIFLATSIEPEAQKPTPSIPNGGLTRKQRRAQEALAKRAAGKQAAVSASGSSTPRLKEGEEPLTKPLSNGTAVNGTEVDPSSSTFGDEYIAFRFSESEDDAGPSTAGYADIKGKGKEVTGHDRDRREQNGDRDATSSSRRKGRERDDRSSPPPTERRREKEKPSSSRSERERDRGKERYDDERRNGRGHKRRHAEYDEDDGYGNKKQRMDAASKKCPWVNGPELERCQNVAEMMHKEVESFVDWISPSATEDEIRGLIVAQVSKIVKSAFPDAEIHPFGSYQTKLYLPLGDIDLVVLSNSMAYSDKSTVLHALANALKRGGVTSHVTIIAKAKVPIVKFVTNHGRFKVDISINQANGLFSGEIIKGFLRDLIPCPANQESRALRSLVMVTKAFLSQRSMNEVYTGGLGSYSIVCLAVSFLQMHPKIRRGEIDPEKNLGVLVMEFFELYGHYFNYDEVGISLREGGTYFNKRQRGWHAEYKRNMLSIEDPADPSNDISSGSYNFHKVRTAFAGAHGILTATAYLRASMLSSRHHGRSVHLRSHYEPEDLSILSTVMGITQETINHRRLVQELYDRRTLHNTLGVKPKPAVVDDHSSRRGDHEEESSSRSKASRAVDSAWEDAREDVQSEHREHSLDDYDEEGRYAIGRQPPKKRRKTGRASDAHTVVFIDDFEEDEVEEGEYMSDKLDADAVGRPSQPRAAGKSPKNDERRSYWLSKGNGTFESDTD